MSRCSSLNHARAYMSRKYSGSSRNRSAYARSSGSTFSAMSAVDIIGGFFLPGMCASGTSSCASGFDGCHCLAPAGLSTSSQSQPNRVSK
jgi:hypothetical protein